VYLEIQLGALLRGGRIHEHTLETARSLHLRDFFLDIVLGSLTVGLSLGILFAALTFVAVRRINRAPAMAKLVDKTAHQYLEAGFFHWEISRACLRFDPFYRKIIASESLPESGSFIHIGCGTGLLLTFLDVATHAEPSTPGAAAGTQLRLRGVDPNPAKIDIARRILGDRARVECENLRDFQFGRSDVVVSLDQLKSAPKKDRERVLKRAAETVEPGGVLIIRASTAQPWMGLWPFPGLTESRVMEVLTELRSGFTTRVLYRSLRRVVILATRPESDQT
jgi:SAM-dependent methyltransferase